jgi:cell shape-determining protein MreC
MALSIKGTRSRVLFLAILTAVTLVAVDTSGNPVTDGIRSGARYVFSPFSGVARRVFKPFESTWNGIRDYGQLKKDYEIARDRAAANESAAIQAEAQIQQLNELRAELNLPTCSLIPRQTAEVIGRPSTNYESSLEISAGSTRGLKEGQPVITSGGLVGRVGKVSATRAFIILLYEEDLNVKVQINGTARSSKTAADILNDGPTPAVDPVTGSTIEPTTTTTSATGPGSLTTSSTSTTLPDLTGVNPSVDAALGATTTLPPPDATGPTSSTTSTTVKLTALENGLLHGNGPDKDLSVDFIDNSAPIRVGDPVTTRADYNSGSLFPGCLPIGRVSAISSRPGSNQAVISVTPNADLKRINVVTVLLYDPSTTATPTGSPATSPTSVP